MKIFLVLLLLLPGIAAAASDPDAFAYQQKLGTVVPKQAIFHDEAGHRVRLSEMIGGLPTIFALGYFHCPNLCGIVRADLFNALDGTGLVAGRDYNLVALSIDPAETSADASSAKADDVAHFPLPGAASGWHFLTGSADAIHAVADAVGFRDRFDAGLDQFLHPAGLVFTTPHGVVSSYLLGVGYTPGDLQLGVTRARQDSVAAASLPVLLLCFHYDPTTGRYSLEIMKLLRLGGLLTVLTIAGVVFLAFRRERGRS